MDGGARIACTCGAVAARIAPVDRRLGFHARCFCRSCRSADLHLGRPDPVDGVPLFQTTPDCVTIERGAGQLGVFKFAEKSGTLRWHSTCCNTPLWITGPGPGLPFVSLRTDRAEDPAPFGPVEGRVFFARPGGKQGHEKMGRFVWRFLRRSAAARLSGRWRKTPFFGPDGTPAAPLRVLTAEDKAGLPLKPDIPVKQA